jgi:hypothetical protein
MPRAAVKLSPAREPVPMWWEAYFHKRQHQLRERIPRQLAKVGRAMARGELRGHLGDVSAAEYECALKSLLAQGIITEFQRTEVLRFGHTATHVYTYYGLTEQAR